MLQQQHNTVITVSDPIMVSLQTASKLLIICWNIILLCRKNGKLIITISELAYDACAEDDSAIQFIMLSFELWCISVADWCCLCRSYKMHSHWRTAPRLSERWNVRYFNGQQPSQAFLQVHYFDCFLSYDTYFQIFTLGSQIQSINTVYFFM